MLPGGWTATNDASVGAGIGGVESGKEGAVVVVVKIAAAVPDTVLGRLNDLGEKERVGSAVGKLRHVRPAIEDKGRRGGAPRGAREPEVHHITPSRAPVGVSSPQAAAVAG